MPLIGESDARAAGVIPRRLVLKLSIAALGLAVFLPACFADRSGTGAPASLSASAEPVLVCPGDPVEVTWAYDPVGSRVECPLTDSAEDCPIASVVDLSRSDVPGPPDPRPNRDSETIRPDEDLTLSFVGYQVIRAGGAAIETLSTSVTIDVVEPPQRAGGHAVGICDGTTASWDPVTISGHETWGETLAVSEVCTLPTGFYDFVDVRLNWSDGFVEELPEIPRGECRPTTLRRARILESITVQGRPLHSSVSCPPRSETGPPAEPRTPENINLGLELTCNERG